MVNLRGNIELRVMVGDCALPLAAGNSRIADGEARCQWGKSDFGTVLL